MKKNWFHSIFNSRMFPNIAALNFNKNEFKLLQDQSEWIVFAISLNFFELTFSKKSLSVTHRLKLVFVCARINCS